MIVKVGYFFIIFCAITSALKSERNKEIDFPNDVNPNGEFVINSPGRVKRQFYGDNGWIDKDWNGDGLITDNDDIPLWQQNLQQELHDNINEIVESHRLYSAGHTFTSGTISMLTFLFATFIAREFIFNA